MIFLRLLILKGFKGYSKFHINFWFTSQDSIFQLANDIIAEFVDLKFSKGTFLLFKYLKICIPISRFSTLLNYSPINIKHSLCWILKTLFPGKLEALLTVICFFVWFLYLFSLFLSYIYITEGFFFFFQFQIF